MADEDKKTVAMIGGAGGGGCFRAGARILLEHGKTAAIETLKAGDEVLAFDEDGKIHLAKVTKVHYHADPQPILKVKFWRGETHITPNHWVLNQYASFVEMGSLTEHDALVDGMGHLRPIVGAELIGYEPVWNLTVEPHHTFICDGVRVHNGGHRERYPVIAGAGGGGGSKGGGGAVEDPDSLQSRAMVSLLDLVGEGEIGGLMAGGQSIFLNDTPLQNANGTYNFNGVTWAARNGTQNQTPIEGHSDIETPAVVGTQVKYDMPKTVTITNPNVDKIRAIVTFPSLASTNTKTGDIHGTTVQYKFQISADGGPFNDVIASTSLFPATGAQTTEYGATQTLYNSSTDENYTVTPVVAVVGEIYDADALGIGVTITASYSDPNVNTIGDNWDYWTGSVELQPQVHNGAAWVNHGGTVKLNYQDTWNNYQATSPSVFHSVDGYKKIRFVVVGASNLAGIKLTDFKKSSVTSTITVTGKSRSRYQRSHMLTLPKPATGWNLRMVRLTPDSEAATLANDTYFDSYVEIVDSKLSYPNSALIGVRIDSSQFNQIPRRSYLVSGLYIKVPSNYNPATRLYSGVWDGTFKIAVSNNPAWVLYDILTNGRYGLGQFITSAQVDKAKLYQIGRYCDELVPDGFGRYEPRFTLNTAIQSIQEAYRLIANITSVFRGMAFWNGGMVGFTQDAPSGVSMEYNNANVIDGMFNYTGSSRKDRHSVVLVTWNDPTENYKRKVEYIEDPGLVAKYGIRKADTVAFGCTSRGQAHRLGKWILYTERDESNVISFKVGIDSALVIPGEVIRIADQYRSGKRMGGRLLAATTTSATLDAPVTLSGSGASLSVRLPDGTFADRVILEAPGTRNVVTWADPLPDLPVPNAVWIISEVSLEPMMARVVGITQDGESKNTFVISAIEHNPNKYGAIELGLTLERPNNSLLSISSVVTPEDFKVTESAYLAAPSTPGFKMHVSWFGSASSYELQWRRSDSATSNWETITTKSLSVEIDGINPGTHELKLVALNAIGGARSQPLALSFNVLGLIPAPEKVENFVVGVRTTDLQLRWSPAEVIGPALYEVRVGPSWDDAEVIMAGFSGNTMIHDQSEAGSYRYHIRSINGATGQYSNEVTTAVFTVDAPATVSGFDCVQNGSRIEFRWNANPERGIVGYEIREGTTWASSSFVTQVNATTYSTPANSVEGARTFLIKAIVAPGVYSDVATFSTTEVAKSSDRNVIVTVDEWATGWLGSKFNVSTFEDDLVLDPGKTYGEYTWGVSLPQTYRARNSVHSTFDALIADTTTWGTASYRWVDPQSGRSWIITGDLAAVDITYYISKFVGLNPSYIEGFGLNAETVGVNGTVATQATGLTYDAGRFLKGAYISDFTRLNWNITVPETFSKTFWAIPKSIVGNQVYLSAETASGLHLMVGHDAVNGWFYLEDSMGQKITVPYTIEPEDRVLVGIVQTASERKLHIGRLNDVPASASAAHLPLGPVTKIKLHQ